MKDQHFLFAIGFTDCLKMTAMQEAVLVLSQSEKKNLLICPFFFLFSFFIEIISLVTECIFWQLSNQKYFGFHPNIKTCQKN